MPWTCEDWCCRCCGAMVPYAFFMTVIHFNMAWLIQGQAPPHAPSNLTVTYVTNSFAIATWTYSGGSDSKVSRFEMTICPTSKSSSRHWEVTRYCMLISLEPYLSRIRIDNLKPATIYLVYMTAVNDERYSNKSNHVNFTTISDSGVFRAGDACVVLIVIVMWVIAVVLFLQKWGSIRIVQPREPRYRFSPKNLDTIRVVKRATDSVIYKGYSRQLSFTMEKREQKLERMNTLQTIEMEKEKALKQEQKLAAKAKKKCKQDNKDSLKDKKHAVKERAKEFLTRGRSKEKELSMPMEKIGEKQTSSPKDDSKIQEDSNVSCVNIEPAAAACASPLGVTVITIEKSDSQRSDQSACTTSSTVT